ncbi:PHP domain-containing protein [Inmirania thermothiophila]|uniref:Polymerase/histidinol phosphatase N-terminal domain-containing protein n=1 Tax=Inmirania thermothiophila TaxID=1750597 RepID=A0A3N1Y159_9GAMM|nr:PHP domain-containing protein [Inmirania thermothiophila]ROR32258.1 hypothetical protein EDC57_1455 [Inmirania thermothiophila]
MPAVRVDLHTHTTASDGTLPPAAVVTLARSSGVGLLAVTDHDTVAGLAEARAAAQAGPVLVTGVELSATWAGRTVHVVGLGIDPAEATLQGALAALREAREARAERMAGRLARLGETGTLEEARGLAAGAVLTRTHFARVLIRRGRARDVGQALRRFLGRGRPGYVAWRWPDLAETVAVIRAAGGRAVLAHPLRYRLSRPLLEALLREFAAAGGEAAEIVPGPRKGADLADLAAIVRRLGLAGSVGSDFHEPGMTPLLGGTPPLPEGIPPVWAAWRAMSGAA